MKEVDQTARGPTLDVPILHRVGSVVASLLFVLTLFATVPVRADEGGPWVVPTELCRGYWFVPISLNEQKFGAGKVLNLIYDTGASSTRIDADALRRATGRSFDDGDRVRLVDASAGDIIFRELPARVDELGHLSMALGRSVDGILAVDAFKDFLLTLDPEQGRMSLTKGKLPRPDGKTVFSTRGPDKRPWLKVTIAGIEKRLLVDSGAAGSGIQINDIEDFPLHGEPRVLSSSVRLNEVEKNTMARLDGSVSIAGLTLVDPVIEEVPKSPILGGEVLQHFEMTLDQRHRRTSLRLLGPTEIPPQPHFELGISFQPTDRGLLVTDVYEDTPGEAAGIQPGDLVIGINGKRPEERGCARVGQDGGSSSLTIERDGTVLEKTLDMVPIIPVDESLNGSETELDKRTD